MVAITFHIDEETREKYTELAELKKDELRTIRKNAGKAELYRQALQFFLENHPITVQ